MTGSTPAIPMSERFGLLVLALVLALGPVRAHAAPSEADKAEARRHFEAGVAKVKVGNFGEAAAEFMRAYELSPSPTPLYNVAVARAQNGQTLEAIAMFRRYLTEGGDKVPADRRARVLKRIAELDAKLGRIKLRVSPETAKATLDGKPVDLAAAAEGVKVAPGYHAVAATSDGCEPREESVEVDQGAVVDVKLVLVPIPVRQPQPITPDHSPSGDVAAAPPPPSPSPALVARAAVVPPPSAPVVSQPVPPPRREGSGGGVARPLGYVLAAVGAASLAAGGVLYLIAKSDRQKAVDAGCTMTTCMGPGATYWGDAQDGVTRSRIAAIAGGVLLVGGVTLVIVAPPGRDAPAGIAIGGRF